MKYLFCADIHINEFKRLDDTKKALDFVLKIAHKEAVGYVVLLGDVFDKRKPTPTELRVLNNWLMYFWWPMSIEILILEGNHDIDRDVSSLSYLKDLEVEGVKVVRPPHVFNEFYLGHEHVNGAVADNGIVLSGGKSLDDIILKHPECKVFAFGDFHKPQVLKKDPFSFYAGSITKTNFSERDDEKRLWLFEGTNLVKTIPIPTRLMFQFDVEVKENTPYNYLPFTGVDKKQIRGSSIKLVYKGTKAALRQIRGDINRIKEILLDEEKVAELKIVYETTDRSKPRNENINESVTEQQALEEYFKDKDVKNKQQIIKKGLELINEQ